jgi:large subunit ribosomal protein L18
MRNSEIASKNRKRDKRKFHIRKRLEGSAARPRLTVFKSNRYMYLQAVDDASGATIAAASTLEETLKGCERNVAKLGEEMGKRLKEKNVGTVVFDRNGYLYHGIVKAMADGARKAGIQF